MGNDDEQWKRPPLIIFQNPRQETLHGLLTSIGTGIYIFAELFKGAFYGSSKHDIYY